VARPPPAAQSWRPRPRARRWRPAGGSSGAGRRRPAGVAEAVERRSWWRPAVGGRLPLRRREVELGRRRWDLDRRSAPHPHSARPAEGGSGARWRWGRSDDRRRESMGASR
jgi:hypothetical protein